MADADDAQRREARASMLLGGLIMAATTSPSTDDAGRNWKTAGTVVGLVLLGVACIIPLGVSFVFWAPIAIAVAVGMWVVSSKRRRRLHEEGRGPDESIQYDREYDREAYARSSTASSRPRPPNPPR